MISKRKKLYDEIYERLKNEISQLPMGTKLPSEEKLCETFGVSRTIIREVIVALERDGFVIRKQGLGTFVIRDDKLVHTGIEYLRGLFKIISSSGKIPSFLINDYEKVKVDKNVARRLQIQEGEEIIKTKHFYAADGFPVIYAETYMATGRIHGGTESFLKAFLQNKTKVLFSLLEEDLGRPVRYAVAEIIAIAADQKLSNLLRVDIGKPLVLLSEVHYGIDDLPLLYSEDYINTDVFLIQIIRKKI
jgi:GntR family transcriptional regulator